jgi:hypothetical protein
MNTSCDIWSSYGERYYCLVGRDVMKFSQAQALGELAAFIIVTEIWGNKFLRNVGIYLPNYMASHTTTFAFGLISCTYILRQREIESELENI